MGAFSTRHIGGGRELRFIQVHVSETPYWEYVTRTNTAEGVTIVAVTEKREIVLVKQYRVPLDRQVIELPAGLVGDKNKKETPQQAVQKELLEETGYMVAFSDIMLLARGPALAGLTNEINGMWLASNATCVDLGGGVGSEGEKIETLVLPLDTVWHRLRTLEHDGYLVDLKVFAGLHFLRDAQR
jgi:ADP-ribose pyrophosphatase